MKRTLVLWAGCYIAIIFAACNHHDEAGTISILDNRLTMEASVSSVALSRTSSSVDGHTSFVEGDQVGLFMPEQENSVCWTYDDASGWSSAEALTWPNQRDDFDFCAYYPYEPAAIRSLVPMPDLNGQLGELETIGDVDFVVARKTCGFADNMGNLSFTGEDAFGHVYSLILITLMTEEGDAATTLQRAEFKGGGAFTNHSYSFATNGIVPGETVQNDFSLPLDALVPENGYMMALLVNPSEAERILEFSLSYSRGEINYVAKTSGIRRTFLSGVCYKYKIRIQKEELSLIGSDIVDWGLEEILEDLIIKDTPAPVG